MRCRPPHASNVNHLAGLSELPGVAAPVRVIDTRIRPHATGRLVPVA